MYVIITASHSLCRNKRDNLCDRKTFEIAKKLEDKIQSTTNVVPTVYLSNVFRDIIDLNRIESRKTTWRNQIKEDITKALINDNVKHIIVFDIHSFPNGFGFGTSLVILNNLLSKKEGSRLYNNLIDDNVPGIKMLIGSDKNDIQLELEHMDQHYSKNIDTFLLEFSDNLTESQLQKILNVIVKLIKKTPDESGCAIM